MKCDRVESTEELSYDCQNYKCTCILAVNVTCRNYPTNEHLPEIKCYMIKIVQYSNVFNAKTIYITQVSDWLIYNDAQQNTIHLRKKEQGTSIYQDRMISMLNGHLPQSKL